jgi:hypothetical protein
MLVLIATNELQGAEPGDYAWTVEGELVTLMVTECSNGDECGCNRGFPGLASDRATTTAMIVERPDITEAELREAVEDWLDRCGWIRLLEDAAIERSVAAGHGGSLGVDEEDEIDDMIAALVDEHMELVAEVCAAFPVGTVVTRSGDRISARRQPFAA